MLHPHEKVSANVSLKHLKRDIPSGRSRHAWQANHVTKVQPAPLLTVIWRSRRQRALFNCHRYAPVTSKTLRPLRSTGLIGKECRRLQGLICDYFSSTPISSLLGANCTRDKDFCSLTKRVVVGRHVFITSVISPVTFYRGLRPQRRPDLRGGSQWSGL